MDLEFYNQVGQKILQNAKKSFSLKACTLAGKFKKDERPLGNNMTTHNSKCFLVFKTQQFITSKRPGLNDLCLFLEMEESWASET